MNKSQYFRIKAGFLTYFIEGLGDYLRRCRYNIMDFWLTEENTAGYSVNWKFTKTVYTEQTEYQHLAIIETNEFGRALVLDGVIQTTERDEFIYHEMIAHPALISHPHPQKVLVIGGGDGGTVKEILKHQTIQQVDLVEIDGKVIWASKEYLPRISCGLNDKRVNIFIEDGLKFIKKKQNYYDAVIIDSSDPVGPAVALFSEGFYRDVYNSLQQDGIMVAQTESPQFNADLLASVNKKLSGIFPITRTFLTSIASYIGGFFSFTVGSKEYDPLAAKVEQKMLTKMNLKYYNSDIHKACFALPNFVRQLLIKEDQKTH